MIDARKLATTIEPSQARGQVRKILK